MAIITEKHRIVFVTGPSGAGRTTALRSLEDLGFEVIDNLPLAMVPHLVNSPAINRSLALGVDVRNRDFSVSATLDAFDFVAASDEFAPSLLFLNANEDVLLRRFSETRRRHPLGSRQSVEESIIEEAALLERLRTRSDILIDTSDLTPHDLKTEISKWYGQDGAGFLTVSVSSFSYKRGLPKGVDMVMDCRFLRNPHWDEGLRPFTGKEPRVGAYIEKDPKFSAFSKHLEGLMEFLLPAYLDEGKANFGIAFGCTGGRHRSVYLAETLSKHLKLAGWLVKTNHREIE